MLDEAVAELWRRRYQASRPHTQAALDSTEFFGDLAKESAEKVAGFTYSFYLGLVTLEELRNVVAGITGCDETTFTAFVALALDYRRQGI